ncbi:monovalent cation/H+ antiporter subunit D [Pseudidiomarina donghaiensis]|uniref:Monovalent cation/H+ antiporter subunit D n=1 Tax=Pseudidiomarina donghaiensis TaxID=519452 RepID=A0A432XBA8_9GAMM|nr:monovalent cation/H+ antiporter subunit D [Pseudidiomarina donghaiensis]RUO46034.1 monovalent cation/H+ antiporter subunit D [Pseudidiomarina donghaiensis]SFV25040.1 multisubunit potassium/proton antiporter, PhaD subunit (TC 2.A.63.1.1) [Pseudidiomarina donghaiensis]
MLSQHLVILPLLIPMVTALLQLLPWGENPQRYRRALGMLSCTVLIVCATFLLTESASTPLVYALGSWQAPYGIVLVADGLSSLMVLLTAVLAFPVLWFACYGEDNLGSHFQALFQFQLLGIIGAFLTGDLFNLFVFFEVLLISSYALLMHGGGKLKLRATLHYVLLNLTGSAVFLISLGVLYGITGTLNMADLAIKIAALEGDNASIARAGGLLLLIVFALKAALLPLYFWLPQAYAMTTGTVAALFAIMTKVGIYAIIRVFTLLFGDDAGAAALLGYDWLWWLGLGTLAIGAIGVLGSRDLRLVISYLVVISVGTMLTVFSMNSERSISAVMYYMLHSTLITAALFLLVDVIAKQRGKTASRIIKGRRMAQHAALGIMFFIAAIAIIGMPPFSGFIGKLLILEAARTGAQVALLWPLVLGSTFLVMVALSRAGSRMFWHTFDGKPGDVTHPQSQLIPIGMLLAAIVGITVFADVINQFVERIAYDAMHPAAYIEAVLGGPHAK